MQDWQTKIPQERCEIDTYSGFSEELLSLFQELLPQPTPVQQKPLSVILFEAHLTRVTAEPFPKITVWEHSLAVWLGQCSVVRVVVWLMGRGVPTHRLLFPRLRTVVPTLHCAAATLASVHTHCFTLCNTRICRCVRCILYLTQCQTLCTHRKWCNTALLPLRLYT